MTEEEVRTASGPAKTAFQAQRDNRLMRAWEYTVASTAAKSPDNPYCQIMTAGAKKALLDLLNTTNTKLKQGQSTTTRTRILNVCQTMNDEVEKLFDENVEFNYDPSIAHTRPGDGRSSRGGWFMYCNGKKIETEEQYKSMLKDLVTKAQNKVKAALAGDPKLAHVDNVAKGLTDGVDDPGFTAAALNASTTAAPPHLGPDVVKPWASAGGGFSNQLMEVYFGQAITTEHPTTTPTSEEDVTEWLLDMSRKISQDNRKAVGLDPENGSMPLSNGPHAYSFRPGSPFFKKNMDKGPSLPPTSAQLITDYKNKAASRRTTAFPLNDPLDGMVKKLVEKAINPQTFASDIVDSIRTRVADKLKALHAAEVTAEQVRTCAEQAIDEEFTQTGTAWDDYRNACKSRGKQELSNAIQTEILAPVDVAELGDLMDKVLNKVGKHLSTGDRDKVKKAVETALTSGGETEASMPKIQKAVVDAIKALPVDPRLPSPPPPQGRRCHGRPQARWPPGHRLCRDQLGLGQPANSVLHDS
jgi:hypothetical protein